MVSKLVAGREKDNTFAHALVREGLIDPATIAERIEMVDVHRAVLKRLQGWVGIYR